MSAPLVALTVAAAVGCGAVGGVFFAFSGFVMPALRRLPAAQGVAAMQSIYLVGEIVVTRAYKVPLNDELAALDDPARWPSWVAAWSAGNHVRTVAGIAAAAALSVALHLG
jgi:uncharacterized membrane protein